MSSLAGVSGLSRSVRFNLEVSDEPHLCEGSSKRSDFARGREVSQAASSAATLYQVDQRTAVGADLNEVAESVLAAFRTYAESDQSLTDDEKRSAVWTTINHNFPHVWPTKSDKGSLFLGLESARKTEDNRTLYSNPARVDGRVKDLNPDDLLGVFKVVNERQAEMVHALSVKEILDKIGDSASANPEATSFTFTARVITTDGEISEVDHSVR